MSEKNNSRTCKTCGQVAFAVSRQFAEYEVKRFNDFFETLNGGDRESFGNRKASMAIYERCTVCGGSYDNFRVSKLGDCPTGCTLSPIIYEGN